MAPRLREPIFKAIEPSHLDGIFVCGVKGIQPPECAIWYLARGYRVFDATNLLPLIARLAGVGEATKLRLFAVRYPPQYKPRTQEPAYTTSPFSLGGVKDAYKSQIREVDYASERLRQHGERRIPSSLNRQSCDAAIILPTVIPFAKHTLATNKPRRGNDDILLKLIENSEDQRHLRGVRKGAMSDPPDVSYRLYPRADATMTEGGEMHK
ncbi:uncharacterized protein PV09_01414 [Verruconis gallopava]|uniref:Uncharacterized protein n=1 Tax=Verruconis gallopava TaxID=253628 RepID=A0A0D2BB88_9PEZI|nr:uncharacterized protein PV09_01414 [Verruconis gallopava]KIW08524.1 hypothetical protein PV09_01414 [Verruconis gallopava]